MRQLLSLIHIYASNAEDKAGAVAAGINPADTKVEGAVQDDVTAVSYTHLDVYKRQT